MDSLKASINGTPIVQVDDVFIENIAENAASSKPVSEEEAPRVFSFGSSQKKKMLEERARLKLESQQVLSRSPSKGVRGRFVAAPKNEARERMMRADDSRDSSSDSECSLVHRSQSPPVRTPGLNQSVGIPLGRDRPLCLSPCFGQHFHTIVAGVRKKTLNKKAVKLAKELDMSNLSITRKMRTEKNIAENQSKRNRLHIPVDGRSISAQDEPMSSQSYSSLSIELTEDDPDRRKTNRLRLNHSIESDCGSAGSSSGSRSSLSSSSSSPDGQPLLFFN
jgi:CheY-like chemotaxis protein